MALAVQELRSLAAHQEFVRAQLRRFGASPSALDDLAQEVWVVSLARSPRLPDEGATRAWLTQVCRRVAAGERRTRTRTPLLTSMTPELPVQPEQVDRIERDLDEQQCLAALARLDEEQIDVLSLYGSGDLSMREVAELIGAPERTVYSRYRAAIDEVSRELRRSQRIGARTSSAPPPRPSSKPPKRLVDREALADGGELVIYRNDGQMVIGRIGNVVVSRWRGRIFERSVQDLGHAMDLAYADMGRPVVILNDGDPDVRLPTAAERGALRHHIREHSHQAGIAVDIFNTPLTRLVAAIVNGIMLITRSSTSFAMVPSLEAARSWVEPHAYCKSGSLDWERVADAVEQLRSQP